MDEVTDAAELHRRQEGLLKASFSLKYDTLRDL